MECEYHNCGNHFSSERENQKYCSIKCKANAAKYRQREEMRFKKEKERVNKIIDQYKLLQTMDNNEKEKADILSLYKKIYG